MSGNAICQQKCPSGQTFSNISVGDTICLTSDCATMNYWITYSPLTPNEISSNCSVIDGKHCGSLLGGAVPVTLTIPQNSSSITLMTLNVPGKANGQPVQYGDLLTLTLFSSTDTVLALAPIEPYFNCYSPQRGYYYNWISSSTANNVFEYSFTISSALQPPKAKTTAVLYGEPVLLSSFATSAQRPSECLNSPDVCNANPCLANLQCGNFLTAAMPLRPDPCLGSNQYIPYPGKGSSWFFFKGTSQGGGEFGTAFITCMAPNVCLTTACPSNICTNNGLCPNGGQPYCDPVNGWTNACATTTTNVIPMIVFSILITIIVIAILYSYERKTKREQATREQLEKSIFQG